MCFVVGAPRSGTTWLQQLLYAHPLVATGGETHLFCEVLPAAFENFNLPDPTSNLRTWVSRDQLLTFARAFCDSVFAAQRDGTRPDAQVILEKTPNHRLQSALQAQVYPDARYVHIIRDGRDATSSQRANWSGLAKEYANAGAMARAWANEVRDIRQHLGPLAYLELRYEDVVADTPAALAAIFDHVGLPHTRQLCEDATEFGRAPVNTYLGSFGVGVRKHEGDALAERSVARAAGDLLTELGYADAAEVARMSHLRTPATVAADARDAARTTAQRSRRLWHRGVGRLRRELRNRQTRPVKTFVSRFVAAMEASDAAALAQVMAPQVSIDGAARTDAATAAKELVARLGDCELAHRSVFGAQAQLTFVSPDGARVVLRVTPRDGVAAEFALL
jgi:LPS sulfotransferase NodH